MKVYIICGYGIPENIENDVNYTTYLNTAFNTIYSESADLPALIIPCGGPTNCTPPYSGTEAETIADYLENLKNRERLVDKTTDWIIEPEKNSLSSLENLVFAKEIINQYQVTKVTIFCEKTREHRNREIAKEIFKKPTHVQGIDFDISNNRYLDPEILRRKEKLGLKEALWALESPGNLKTHHDFFGKKFEYLRRRQQEGLNHVEAVEEWFKHERDLLAELAPDHPLLKQI